MPTIYIHYILFVVVVYCLQQSHYFVNFNIQIFPLIIATY
jgi:hypothetical protein